MYMIKVDYRINMCLISVIITTLTPYPPLPSKAVLKILANFWATFRIWGNYLNLRQLLIYSKTIL